MAALFTSSKFSATDANGNPLAGGKVYTYAAGTLTPKATYTTQAGDVANANPVILDSTGRANIWLGSGAYKFVIQDSTGATAPDGTVDNVTAPGYEVLADIASTSSASLGAGLVGFDGELNYSASTLGWEARHDIVRPEWFGAVFNASYTSGSATGTDDTAAIQAAVSFAAFMSGGAGSNFPVAQPVTVVLPAGDAIISASITANRRVRIRGQGCWATRLICKTAGASFYGITLRPNGTGGCPIIGAEVSDLQIVGDGGATRCSGISTGSTAPYTITKTTYKNLVIWNTATGMSIGDGVDNSFYNNNFENILVTGTGTTGVTAYGIKLNNAVYCRFSGIEVTGVASTAYGFFGIAGWSTFTQLACDGVSNIDIPNSTLVGFAVEGIIAATTVAGTALAINRIKMLSGVSLIDCPNAKTPYGLTINAAGTTVVGLSVVDTGGGQPDYPFLPADGTTGALLGFMASTAPPFKVETVLTAATMAGWMWHDCAQLTDYGYKTDLRGSATYDPANLADGAGVTTTVTVTGAALGGYARASFSLDLQGIALTAWVSSANTVSVRFQNETGAPVDLASGTLQARVSGA